MIGIVLAGGKSSRFKHEKSKFEYEFKGKPIVKRVVDALQPCVSKVFVVVGENEENIRNILGNEVEYVKQNEPLGTGHALLQCDGEVDEEFILCYADKPLVTEDTFNRLKKEKNIVIATIVAKDPLKRGRILRKDGKFNGIREFKDATDEEKEIKEVNAGIYKFDLKVFDYLKRIKNDNASKEYYLTDVFDFYLKDKVKIELFNVSEEEGFDVNTLEEIEMIGGKNEL